jgi:hypothetical protein
MQSSAATIEGYLASLPADRRKTVGELRGLILRNLPPGFKEVMQWGMIGYVIPLERYPDTYNGQPLALAGLASQKNYISLYLMAVYGHKGTEEWFKAEYAKSGKKLAMGKSCLRLKTPEDIPLALIEKTIARVSVEKYIETYESVKGKSLRAARADTGAKRKSRKG